MNDPLIARLTSRFESYDELAGTLTDELLERTLDVPKHKSLANHLWCLVGARESYARALDAGRWVGFDCSISEVDAESVRGALASSASAVREAIDGVDEWDDARTQLLLSLYEHEVVHEGQIIRHMYALELTLPESWFWA